jgi:hypothetical protein
MKYEYLFGSIEYLTALSRSLIQKYQEYKRKRHSLAEHGVISTAAG